MSRSKRDQRGSRTNGEIWGYNEYIVGPGGKVYAECGGSEVGSADRKRDAKKGVARLRRMKDKRDIILSMHDLT